MFSKKQRLNTSLFDEVFNFGKKKYDQHFVLKYKENKIDESRFAVVVSKKKIKKAVQRHFLKRRFFGALKKSKLANIKKDYIFILNESIKDKSQKDMILIINKIELE